MDQKPFWRRHLSGEFLPCTAVVGRPPVGLLLVIEATLVSRLKSPNSKSTLFIPLKPGRLKLEYSAKISRLVEERKSHGQSLIFIDLLNFEEIKLTRIYSTLNPRLSYVFKVKFFRILATSPSFSVNSKITVNL